MYTLTYAVDTFVEPKVLLKKWDNFVQNDVTPLEGVIEEAIAYYNGQPVTQRLVESFRGAMCEGPAPLPFNNLGPFSFHCEDGVYESPYDLSTLYRHFELVEISYETWGSKTKGISVPFPMETVRVALQAIEHYTGSMRCPVKCLKFLLVKNSSYCLRYDTATIDGPHLLSIGKEMSPSAKLLHGRYASLLLDDKLAPIVGFLYENCQWDALKEVLAERPAMMLFLSCLRYGEESYKPNNNSNLIGDLIEKTAEKSDQLSGIISKAETKRFYASLVNFLCRSNYSFKLFQKGLSLLGYDETSERTFPLKNKSIMPSIPWSSRSEKSFCDKRLGLYLEQMNADTISSPVSVPEDNV